MNRFEAIVARLNGEYELTAKFNEYNSYHSALAEQYSSYIQKFAIPSELLQSGYTYNPYTPLSLFVSELLSTKMSSIVKILS